MFYNTIIPREKKMGSFDPGHDNYLPLAPDHTLLIFLIMIFFGLHLLVSSFIKCGKSKKDEFHIDENIGKFFNSISGLDQKLWYTNECYHRKLVGQKTISDENLEKLRTYKKENKVI